MAELRLKHETELRVGAEEMTKIKSDLEEALKDREQLEEELRSVGEKMKSFDATVAELRADNAKLQDSLGQERQIAEKLRSEHSKAETQLQNQVAMLEAEKMELVAKNAKISADLAASDPKAMDSLENERNSLAAKVAALEKEKGALLQDVKDHKLKIEDAKGREEELNAEVEKYLKSNEDLFNENEQLNQELDELRDLQISSLSSKQDSAPQSNQALEEEKKKHATTQALLSDYIEQLRSKDDERVHALKKLQAEHDQILLAKDEQIRQLREQAAKKELELNAAATSRADQMNQEMGGYF